VCLKRQKQGSKICPTKPVRAADVEALVVEKIREIARDPALIQETVLQVRRRAKERTKRLKAERRKLQRDLRTQRDELNGLLAALAKDNGGFSSATERLGELEERKQKVERRLETIDGELTAIEGSTVDEQDVAAALSAFGPVWDELFQAEKERIVRLAIERVDCGGAAETLAFTVRDSGVSVLAQEMVTSSHEDS
jgi:septal ring factor EnvC (AmiA/AmiB activator)